MSDKDDPKKLVGKKWNMITLAADDLWVIRSTKTSPKGEKTTRYYETPSVWNSAPSKATIFTSFDAAEAHMGLMRNRDLKDMKGWGDGSTEEFDIVPLHTEILHSPNGKNINLKKKK